MDSHLLPDEEIFDDIHEGIQALREASGPHDSSMTARARETIRKLEVKIPVARAQARKIKNRLKEKTLAAAYHTHKTVQDNPWVSSLSAFVFGILAGYLVMRCVQEDETQPLSTDSNSST